MHYLTMEFIEGKPMSEVLNERQAVDQAQIAASSASSPRPSGGTRRGVIHRDLKPANIMIDRKGEPIIVDFGLARLSPWGRPADAEPGRSWVARLHVPRAGRPTPSRSEPRLRHLRPRRHPLRVAGGAAPLPRVAGGGPEPDPTQEPEPPSTHRPGLDPELEAICLKAMAKRPAARYASMAELAAALGD